MTIELVKTALINERKIAKLHKQQETIRENEREDTNRLKYDVYRARFRKLQEEQDARIKSVVDKAEAIIQKKGQLIAELAEPVDQVKRILELMKLDTKKKLAIDDADIMIRNNHYKEALGPVVNDDYLKAKIYILENDKPKNKYSLCIFGKCLFGEDILRLPRSYGLPGYQHEHYDLMILLRDFPSVAEAKAWLVRTNVNQEWLENYKAVKTEYIKVKATYTRRQFSKFIALRCKCGFLHTTFDKDSYSSRYFDEDPTCPRCSAHLKVSS